MNSRIGLPVASERHMLQIFQRERSGLQSASMPVYQYFCEANGRTVDVRHRMNIRLSTWGEVCYAAQIPLDDTDFLAPVRKSITAPAVVVTVGNAELKAKGFTKLVKRDTGVYENVTAGAGEARYMKTGDSSSLPQLHKKISD